MYLSYLACISVNISYQSRIISQYRARHSYKKSLQSCITTITYVTTLPHRGRVGPPPSKGVAKTLNPTTGKENETSQPTAHYTIEPRSRCHGWTKWQPFPYPDTHPPSGNPPPVGKAGFEVWVLSKGGLVSVHHCRLYRTVVHAHRVGSYDEP